jgi:hypothetical protein
MMIILIIFYSHFVLISLGKKFSHYKPFSIYINLKNLNVGA